MSNGNNTKSKYYLDLDKKWTAHNYKPIPVVIDLITASARVGGTALPI